MIPPSRQWCHMIEITNACHLHCSNCTRLLDHARRRYFMDVPTFTRAVEALADFPAESERDPQGRGKVIGIMGGEPLLHPKFPELAAILVDAVPDVRNRGLWTSLDWTSYEHPRYGPAAPHVTALVGPHADNGRGVDGQQGWLNWNLHLKSMRVEHAPVLAAARDLVPDERDRWQLIEDCWLQSNWSSSITPRGFFFCEVAAAMATVFGDELPDLRGKPIAPGCWDGELEFYTDDRGIRQPRGRFADQVLAACENCGVCVPQQGRPDHDEIDDVSVSTLAMLERVGSPRAKRGRVKLHQIETDAQRAAKDRQRYGNPRIYVKGERPAPHVEAR